MPLDKDNAEHRQMSNNYDDKYGGQALYNKAVRPIVHGTYHAGRFINSGNSEEWARAKDQYSNIGTGQTQTEYLQQHREEAKKNQK